MQSGFIGRIEKSFTVISSERTPLLLMPPGEEAEALQH
jgi:hypothetical protein